MDLFLCYIRVMLCGDDHGRHLNGTVVFVTHRHLCLAIRPEIRKRAILTDLGQQVGHVMSEVYRHGHECVGLVGRKAEHHTLVACSHQVELILCVALLRVKALVDA